MAEFEGINKVRTRHVSGVLLNQVIDQANRADRLRGGDGVLIGEDSIGRTVSLEDLPQLTLNAATLARVVNVGTETIPAYGVMGMVESFHKKRGDFQHDRAISVRKPTPEDAGRVAIAIDEIPPKQVGLACIDGVCIVRIVRWKFDPLENGDLQTQFLNKASLHVDEFYALANANGEFDILWEETDFTGEEEHLALVRFKRDFMPLKYKNVGDITVPVFGVVVPFRDPDIFPVIGGNGVTADGLYAALSPRVPTGNEDFICSPSYINLAGDVAAGAKGTMMVGMSIARVTLQVSIIGQTVGPEEDLLEFQQQNGGYTIGAPLGDRNGDRYAVVQWDAAVWK